MTPLFSIDDVMNGRHRNAVFACQSTCAMALHPANIVGANLNHLLVGEFSAEFQFASRCSSLRVSVGIVIGLSPFKQMRWPKTKLYITSMKGARLRPATIREKECDSVNASNSSFKSDVTVSISSFTERPKQTFVRFVGLQRLNHPRQIGRLSGHRSSSIDGRCRTLSLFLQRGRSLLYGEKAAA